MAGCVGRVASSVNQNRATSTMDSPAADALQLVCPDLSKPLDPGPSVLRRLSPEEIEHSIKTALNVDVSTNLLNSIPPDGLTDGFPNNGNAQRYSEQHYDAFRALADDVASKVDLTKWITCSLGTTTAKNLACHRTLMEALSPVLFRGPLVTEYTDRLLALAQLDFIWKDANVEASARQIVSAMLQAPQFLYVVQADRAPDSARPDLIPLSPEELATRLALLLWGEAPDKKLLTQTTLNTADSVVAAATSMISDARTKTARRLFAQRWLRLESFGFPVDDPSLAALPQSSHEEVGRLIDDYFTGAANALDIFRADHFYANKTLGTVYEVPTGNLTDADYQRFDATDNRGGIFTTSAYLMRTSHTNKPSRTFRGQFIRASILCSPLPPPPPGLVFDITKIDEETHGTDPSCAGCHRLMDPIGKGLSRYDQLGRLTDDYKAGKLMEGQFIQGDTVAAFNGGRELGNVIASQEETSRCVVRRTIQWAAGRNLVNTDGCTLEHLHQEFVKSGYQYDGLVQALVRSDAFRYRKSTPTTAVSQ